MPNSDCNQKSIKSYLDNKEEMIEQVFSCINEIQIKNMLPEMMKDMQMEELKMECLVKLLELPNDRILDILEGKKLTTRTELSSSIQPDKIDVKSKRKSISSNASMSKKVTPQPMSIGDEGNGIMELNCDDDIESSPKKKRKSKKRSKKEKSEDVKRKLKSETARMSNSILEDEGESHNTKEEDNTDGKTLLEILELEMRARAIRALLQQEGVNDIEAQSHQNGTQYRFNSDEDCATIEDSSRDHIDLTMDSEDDIEGDKKSEHNKRSTRDIAETLEKCCTEGKNSEASSVGNKSWAERWLQSKEVKRVVATSKMITSVRKKIKSAHRKETPKSMKSDIKIEGSVNEYKMLSKENST